jgi:hypothetical protein
MRTKHVTVGVVAVMAALGIGVATGAYAGRGSAPPGPGTGVQQAELVGRSVLPAETYRPGSAPSGYFTGTTAPIAAPFPGQPVQGFSGVHRNPDGSYVVMSDNGFGNKANSPDFELRVHRIAADTATGVTTVLDGGFGLSDPDGKVPWTIWRDGGCAAAATLPAGFDAPVPTPGVASPSNPTLPAGATPNLANSKGFEGLAIAPDGGTLYPMLEGPVAEDVAARLAADLRIFEVAVDRRGRARYTGDIWRYRMEHPANAIGDFIAVNDHQFLAIERDGGSGPTARFKAVFLVDLRDRDGDGYVDKDLLVNLMAVPDPGGVGGFGPYFSFPFVTIEDVEIVDRDTIAVLNDNNFPGTGGRAPDRPDENELILVRLDRPLDVARGVVP